MTELLVFFKLWHIRCNNTVKKKNNRKYEARPTTTRTRNASKTLDTNKNNTRRARDIDDEPHASLHEWWQARAKTRTKGRSSSSADPTTTRYRQSGIY
ncbi:hypothetical protein QQF40_05020 [Cobetia sp. LC6]|uniref:hypothetical protein n=1 Tax=Cobetia sp. LC6 TaxID=3050947 RepID=UPI0025545BEC|nr:hypothetical protein [Cobetia sp. LC6]MDL2190748.1 hypothetical protein [Cobetia sp. LC6]